MDRHSLDRAYLGWLTVLVVLVAGLTALPVLGAESDLWSTHSGPGVIVSGEPFTIYVGYGNLGPDAAVSAYVNSYFPVPMGMDVFIDDFFNGSGQIFDEIQATATGTDTLGNTPFLFWDNYFCEEFYFQLQRTDDNNEADPIEGLDSGVSALFSYDVTIPIEDPNLGVVSVTSPTALKQEWVGYNANNGLQAAQMNALGRGSCEWLVGGGEEDICQYIDDNCFGARLSLLDPVIEAEFELVDDGSADPTFGCNQLVGFTPGNIALMRRGECQFGTKAFYAEQAGATGVVLVNDGRCGDFLTSEDCVINLAPGDLGGLVSIPVTMVASATGEPLIDAIVGGGSIDGVFGGASVFRSEGNVFLSDFNDVDPDEDNDSSRFLESVIAGGCSYDVSPPDTHFPAGGGAGFVNVDTVEGCPWQSATTVPWITLIEPTSQQGPGVLDYQVDANPGPGRAATIELAQQSHIVTQSAGNGCTYSITPTSTAFPADGGGGAIHLLTSQPGCEWSAAVDSAWLTLTSPTSGIGSATLTFTVDANHSEARAGVILVADRFHHVYQSAFGGCDYSFVTDDGSAENVYGGSIAQLFVQRFAPEDLPHAVTDVCASFSRSGTDDLLDFDVVVYDDDGPGGGPGTLLASIPTSDKEIPEWPDSAFHSVDVEGWVPIVTEGAVYIGVGWDGAAETGFFVAADETPATPPQSGFYSADGSSWQSISMAYPGYRSLMLRHEGYRTPLSDWQQVVGGSVGGGNGFGNPENQTVVPLTDFAGALFAGTVNDQGAEIHYTLDGELWLPGNTGGFGNPTTVGVTTLIEFEDMLYATTWDDSIGGAVYRTGFPPSWTQVANGGFGNPLTRAVVVSAVFNDALFVGTNNESLGCGVWRSTDGSNWMQVNADGFGEQDNERVSALAEFDGELWAGTKNSVTGGEIWRSADGQVWTLALTGGFDGAANREIRGLEVFDGALYAGVTNRTTGAQVWRTFDGTTWERVVADGFGHPDYEWFTDFLSDGDRLLASAYGSVDFGPVWATTNGAEWFEDSYPGFGDPQSNIVFGFGAWRDGLYAGTRTSEGCEVWQSTKHSVFADAFETGDTARWANSVP